MLRRFLDKIQKTDLSLVRRNYADEARFLRKPIRAQLQQEANDAGISTSHPIVVDPNDPNPDGTLPVKVQGTHGPGEQNNPSHILDSGEDFCGTKNSQRVVPPKKSLSVQKSDLKPPIPGSDALLDKQHVKDNLKKAGAKPSAYKSGEKYDQ